MEVELFLKAEDGSVVAQVNNMLGMDENVLVHHLGDGELRFFPTERVMVKGFEDDPNKVFKILKRGDVKVMFHGQVIFTAPDWSDHLVDKLCTEVTTEIVLEGDDDEELPEF